MLAIEARAQIAMARLMVLSAKELERAAIEACDAPKPGAIVRHYENGHLYRVIDQGGDLFLDSLGDMGTERTPTRDWFPYDILQNGGGFNSPADAYRKPEGRELKALADLEELNRDPVFLAELARARARAESQT